MIRKVFHLLAGAVVVLGLGAPLPALAAQTTTYTATDLRTAFNNLLVEHVYVTGLAINAIVRGDDAEATIASGLVDQNNVELSQVVGAGFGADRQKEFLGLWRDEVNATLDYARAAAGKGASGK